MNLLNKVCAIFNERGISYAIVGGYAVALHGAPRGTFDIDLIISQKQEIYIKAEEALKSLGFLPRLPITAREIFQFRKEYIEHRNLIAWSFYNPIDPTEIVDIIITENLDDFKTTEKRVSNYKVKILTKAELIRMKKKSGRKQDLADIEALGGFRE